MDNLAAIDSVNQSLTLTRKLFRRSDPQQRYMMFKYKCLFTNYVVVNEYVKKAFGSFHMKSTSEILDPLRF